MKKSFLLAALLLSSAAQADTYFLSAIERSTLSARCVSESGLSTYDVELNLNSYDGEIRYRFMSQDILYTATIEEISQESIKGVAVFSSSRTGETKGRPFSFVYDLQRNTFTELTVSACVQDMKI